MCCRSARLVCSGCALTGLFFFQAEDGIRDHCVTGVQTCALPISPLLVVCATPLPLSEIVAGELPALLATETLPLTLPAAVGANTTFKVAVWPGARVVLALTPLAP